MAVIDDAGEQLGEFTVPDAIERAVERGLDLVEVAPKANPPVCRFMDYGKYKYKKNKKAHEAKKNQKVIKLKEIKITPRTSEHDYLFKLKHIKRFLDDGSKVKVTVFFRGRQITHPELGKVMLDRYVKDTEEYATIIQEAKHEGRTMNMVLEAKVKKQPVAKKKSSADKSTAQNNNKGEEGAKA